MIATGRTPRGADPGQRRGADVTPKPFASVGAYPRLRLRRNRRDAWSRRLVAENVLTAGDLIWPAFVSEGRDAAREEIDSMPGVFRFTIPALIEEAGRAASLGIPVIALFPVVPPERKSDDGDDAVNGDNLVCRAVTAVKKALPDLGLLCDLALDPFTHHRHAGVLPGRYLPND